jgi:hypothetical protein
MASSTWHFAGWLSLCVGLIGGASVSAHGQEFRVDTEVFQNEDKKPILEQLTIFAADGTIYDFRLTEPQEVTVFDLRRGVCTLLDESRQVKAAVATQELLQFCFNLETHAAQSKNSLLAFCAAPKFETTEKEIDRSGQKMVELRLAAKPLVYVAEGQRPTRPEAVKAYRQFADWCARLNARDAKRGNLPAGARLALNEALADRGLLPLEITRTIPSDRPLVGKPLEHRSQHRVNWTLSGEDRKKIEHAGDMMANFQLVSYDDYCAEGKPAGVKQAKR